MGKVGAPSTARVGIPAEVNTHSNGSRTTIPIEAEHSFRRVQTSGSGGRFQPTSFPDLGPALYRGIRDRADGDPEVADTPFHDLEFERPRPDLMRTLDVTEDAAIPSGPCPRGYVPSPHQNSARR
jgi:hypothetical protein